MFVRRNARPFPIFVSCLLAVSTLIAQASSEQRATVINDDLKNACVLIEGYAIDEDWGPWNDDVISWIRSSVPYSITNDTLILISDASSLGFELLRNSEGFTDWFEGGVTIKEYNLVARFPSGLYLPICQAALATDSFALFKVYTANTLVEGFDYILPEIASIEEIDVLDNVTIVGPVLTAGISLISSTIASEYGIDGTYDFTENVQLNIRTSLEHFAGAPVFLREPDDRNLLFAIVANRGPGTESFTYVRPIPTDPSWINQLQWMNTKDDDFCFRMQKR